MNSIKKFILLLFIFMTQNVSAATYTEYGEEKESLSPIEETELRKVEKVRKYRFYKLEPIYKEGYYTTLEGYIRDGTAYQDVYLYREREKLVEETVFPTSVQLKDFPIDRFLLKQIQEETDPIIEKIEEKEVEKKTPFLNDSDKKESARQKFDKIRQKKEVQWFHNTGNRILLGMAIGVVSLTGFLFLVKK